MSKSCQTWDNFLPLVFPKDSKKSKSFWHWNSGNGDKKTFKRSEQMKYLFKNFFRHDNFTPFMSKIFLIWEHFFHYFSPRISKIEQVWTLDFGKWGQQDRYTEWETPIPKKSCLVRQNLPQKNFFCTAILHPLLVKVLKSETSNFGKWGQKDVYMVPQKWIDRYTDTHMNRHYAL